MRSCKSTEAFVADWRRMAQPVDQMWCAVATVLIGSLLQGCGLLMDAIERIHPEVAQPRDELTVVCRHYRLQVGVAVEPFEPFVFPAVWTDRGAWVTGLDIDLVRRIASAVSTRCRAQVTPVVHLVHVRDLFLLLNEGKLDLFVSAASYNVPHFSTTGLGFSTPYFADAGIGAVIRRPEVAEQVRSALHRRSADGDIVASRKNALEGLTVAAQKDRSPYMYAQANLSGIRLMACETLAAAFDAQDPAVDVILGKLPILKYVTAHGRGDWQLLLVDNDQPFLLTRELFTVVMAENSFGLQWLINDLLFEMEQSGQLATMRRRWFEDEYAYADRATTEGLLATVEKDVQTNGHGSCGLVRKP